MVKRVIVAFAVALAIPVAGFLTAEWILGELIDGRPVPPEVFAYCAGESLFADDGCGVVQRLVMLRDASFWTGVAAFDLMALYFVTAMVAGRSRELNAAIFPLLIPLSLLIVTGLVFVQGAILTYAVAAAEVHAFGRLHIWLVAMIGLGALFGGFKLIGATIRLGRRPATRTFAKVLDRTRAPRLWQFVTEIARKVGAQAPNNIVVGLDPTFFATAADVEVINEDRRVKGETLFLSLPLMRLFNLEELRAVIGHELGHFKGSDTAYTLKFAPVYTGLARAIDTLEGGGVNAATIARLPALSMLSLMIELFARNERMISRDREFEADRVGVAVSSPQALATALGKVAVYGPVWSHVREENVQRLNQGKVAVNISKTYEDSARYDVSHKAVGTIMQEILTTEIPHPTDSHPTIEARFRNIGFDPETLTVETLVGPGGSGEALIDDMLLLERDLTVQEHRLMVMLGAATPPGDSLRQAVDPQPEGRMTPSAPISAPKANPIYTLSAGLISADGNVSLEEIAVAEEAGARLMPGFDRIEFRECCSEADDLPDFRTTVDNLADEYPAERRREVYDYLKGIAMADGELPQPERDLLLYVRRRWEI